MTYFFETYKEARKNIIICSQNRKTRVQSFKHPNDNNLFIDITYTGNPLSPICMIIFSGVHGIEGFCGTACQTYAIENMGLFNDVYLIIVHSVNPYGYANISRTNEDNIDLNRHFINFDESIPTNETYEKLAVFMGHDIWSEDYLSKLGDTIKQIFPCKSLDDIQKEIYSGQYSCKDGVSYGGSCISWSRRVIEKVFNDLSRNRKHTICIDIHSGLGEYGQLSVIHCKTDDESLARTKMWLGNKITSWEDGNAVTTKFNGKMVSGISEKFPDISMTGLTLEFGTRARNVTLKAILADFFLRKNNKKSMENYFEIEYFIKDSFSPNEDKWKHAVIEKFDYFLNTIINIVTNI